MKYVRSLDDFKYLFFDFDGVLFDSNKIRTLGFVTIFKEYPKASVDKLVEYHEINGGLSRYHKIRYFFENILEEEISEKLLQKYANEYRSVMTEKLFDKNLKIRDSIDFIEKNYKRFLKIFIVSGSDQKELRGLCEFLDIKKFLSGIYGSPTAKNELVKNILEENEMLLKYCCLIGDSLNDKEAACNNGITFYSYNNPSLKGFKAIKMFSTLV